MYCANNSAISRYTEYTKEPSKYLKFFAGYTFKSYDFLYILYSISLIMAYSYNHLCKSRLVVAFRRTKNSNKYKTLLSELIICAVFEVTPGTAEDLTSKFISLKVVAVGSEGIELFFEQTLNLFRAEKLTRLAAQEMNSFFERTLNLFRAEKLARLAAKELDSGWDVWGDSATSVRQADNVVYFTVFNLSNISVPCLKTQQ
jgi:hypothetical protein